MKTSWIPVRAKLYAGAFGLAFVIFFSLLQLLPTGMFTGLDQRASDWAWRLGAQHKAERRIVIIDIDEASLAAQGPWPWPRTRIAELSTKLKELGARQQIFDLVFADPRDGDDKLATALKAGNALLPHVFALDQGEPAQSGALMGALATTLCDAPVQQAKGFVGVADSLASPLGYALPGGHITPRIDSDGAVRRIPGLVCFADKTYPAMALAAYANGTSSDTASSIQLQAGKGWNEPAWWMSNKQWPARIPLGERTDITVPYALAPDALISIPATDVLQGKAPRELIDGAWVLIGATAFGLADAVPTPHGGAVGGVSVHAQLLSGLLDDAIPFSPKGRIGILVLPTLLLCLLLALFAARRGRFPVYVLPPLAVAAGFVMLALHILALQSLHWELGWSQPALFVLCFGLALASAEFALTRLEKDRLFGHLASYLPTPVAEMLLGRSTKARPLAGRREVTVLFADIRNFSSFCENRPPEEAAGVLHDFISIATQIIEAHGGLIEAVQGDAIMAIWNGSRPCTDHARKASEAALQLLPAVEQAFPQLPDGELQPLALGIGIESGDALIGSFGPAQRRIHTALGATVTIANALQEMTSELACPILLGPGAASRLAQTALKPQGNFLLEGLTKAHTIYALPLLN